MPQPVPTSSLPTVLLTGFDAFGGDSVNPSWLAAKALHDDVVHGHRCVAAQLPTTFAGSEGVLLKLLRTHKPSLVICLGLAGGRPAFSLERIAPMYEEYFRSLIPIFTGKGFYEVTNTRKELDWMKREYPCAK